MKRNILYLILLVIISLFLVFYISKFDVKDNNKKDKLTVEESIKEEISSDAKNKSVIENQNKDTEDYLKDRKLNILNEIDLKAKEGLVIGCDFKAKNNTIDEVKKIWGEGDSNNYIEEAKGFYCSFKDKDIAIGFNKGSQIFEVRSFSSKLDILNFNDIVNYFGTPQYDIVSSLDERIIGYIINDDFKILFVFSESKENNPILDHYSVLYPKGTVNMMADDSGREW